MYSNDILAIDDDHGFLADLKKYFMAGGLGVAILSDPSLTVTLELGKFRILLLDLDMPELSGQDIMAQLDVNRRPVVIIVSGHSDIDTRLALLRGGADFFMSKPVDLRELFLICCQILDRQSAKEGAKKCWKLSRSKHSIVSPFGGNFGLTSSEFRILELLILASQQAVSRDTLIRAAIARDGIQTYDFYRSLEVMISRMRSRLGDRENPLPVKAHRNVGYVFHGQGFVED
ncbi:response regulator transcription factor [Tabrizicola sp.]|uniref:response regulator transcription factor n=1 Tax=Tabrizicola sp. TaxID=2005166 RepID=UPI003D2BD87A